MNMPLNTSADICDPTEQARYNMVEQQIRPWNVLDEAVLELLATVRREEFVPPAYQGAAFIDTQIPLNPSVEEAERLGQVMLAPRVDARMLQDLQVQSTDRVLEIGAGSGYMAALLAHFARRVVTAEIREDLARFAGANLQRAGISNAAVEHRHGLRAAPGASFEAIVLSGSVPFVPEALLDRLTVGGRLVAIVGELPMMTAQLVTRVADRQFSAENLFDTVALPLVDFPRKEKFVF